MWTETLFSQVMGLAISGGIIFYGVQKFFKEVEEKLATSTKRSISRWLLEVKTAHTVESWPETFSAIFNRVFGGKHLSWTCFSRSCLLSFVLSLTTILVMFMLSPLANARFLPTLTAMFVVFVVASNLLPDYIALASTRLTLFFMKKTKASWVWLLLLLTDAVITSYISLCGMLMGILFQTQIGQFVGWFPPQTVAWESAYIIPIAPLLLLPKFLFILRFSFHGYRLGVALFLPAFFTSAWIWLYFLSGLLLKAARGIDETLNVVNRYLDIDAKPLQSIGLVAASITTFLYWGGAVAVWLFRGRGD